MEARSVLKDSTSRWWGARGHNLKHQLSTLVQSTSPVKTKRSKWGLEAYMSHYIQWLAKPFKCFEQLERFIYILALRFPNMVIMMSNESPASRLSNGTLVIIYGKGPMEIHLDHWGECTWTVLHVTMWKCQSPCSQNLAAWWHQLLWWTVINHHPE